jgi:DNA-binding transcriptional MerR regulator
MGQSPVVIPEKIYFKIGEVCELVGVQAHVLRYWETEFPMLSPQKNRSGQRSYRRRDVEISLRIKELLYDDMFTIAGAKKKLQNELRDGAKPRPAATEEVADNPDRIEVRGAPTDDDLELEFDEVEHSISRIPMAHTTERDEAIRTLAAHLLELREMLKTRNGR